jgi:hypothetical protein
MHRPCLRREHEVVTRRVDRAEATLGPVLMSDNPAVPVGRPVPLGHDGNLRVDTPFAHDDAGALGGWRAQGRLVGRGLRLAHHARVEIVVAPWSDDSCELQVAPRSHRLHQWGERRRRRYWRLAHAAADEVVPLLER